MAGSMHESWCAAVIGNAANHTRKLNRTQQTVCADARLLLRHLYASSARQLQMASAIALASCMAQNWAAAADTSTAHVCLQTGDLSCLWAFEINAKIVQQHSLTLQDRRNNRDATASGAWSVTGTHAGSYHAPKSWWLAFCHGSRQALPLESWMAIPAVVCCCFLAPPCALQHAVLTNAC